jgi:hypothetical protein
LLHSGLNFEGWTPLPRWIPHLGWSGAPPEKTWVERILAKPNYRHQKKQKEQARKLRQAEKQNRRLAARTDAQGTPGSEDLPVTPETAATSGQAET